jgi:hypothetical protein
LFFLSTAHITFYLFIIEYGFSDTSIPRREVTKFKELITKYTYATIFEFLQCISSHLEEIMDSLIDTDISVIEERAKKRWNSTDDNTVKSSMRAQSSPIKKLSSCDPRSSPSPKKKRYPHLNSIFLFI